MEVTGTRSSHTVRVRQRGERGETYLGLHTTASPAYLESPTLHADCGLPHTELTYAHEVAHERVVEQELRLSRKIPCLLTCAQMQNGGTSPVTGTLGAPAYCSQYPPTDCGIYACLIPQDLAVSLHHESREVRITCQSRECALQCT